MWSFICFLIWECLKLFSPAPRDWDYWFLPKTVPHKWWQDSDHAPPKPHGKAGASDPVLSRYKQGYNLPSTQFWDNPSHSWQSTLPQKTQQGIHLQVEDFPALQTLASQRQNILLVGKKIKYLHLTGIQKKNGTHKEGVIWNRSMKTIVAHSEVTDFVSALLRRPPHLQALRVFSSL